MSPTAHGGEDVEPRPTAWNLVTALVSPEGPRLAPAARSRAHRFLLAALPVLALAVGLFRIDRPAPWVDEAVTVLVIRRPWSGILPLLQGADAPLVPYYLLTKAWAGALFWLDPLIAARSLSAVASAVTVAAAFSLVARLSGKRAAVLSALVLISLGGFSRYAQEARPYALLIMTATLSWLTWATWRRPRPGVLRGPASWIRELRHAAAYLLSLIGSVLFHLFGLFQWPAQLLADLLSPRLQRAERVRRALASGVMMALAAILVAVPLGLAATRGTGAPRLVRMTPRQLASDFLLALDGSRGLVPALVVLALAGIAVIALVARSRVALRYDRLVRIGTIWIIVPLVLSIAAAALRPSLLRARYWMPLVVPMSVLAAIGLLVLAEWAWRAVASRRSASGRTVPALAAAFAIIVPLAAHGVLQLPSHLSIRQANGHALNLAPALKELDAILAYDPDLPVATTPNTRTTVVWATRPELIARDPMFELDEHADTVWPEAREIGEVAERLEGQDMIIWLRARIAAAGTTPTPKPTNPPKVLRELGFRVVSAERHGGWYVCILQR